MDSRASLVSDRAVDYLDIPVSAEDVPVPLVEPRPRKKRKSKDLGPSPVSLLGGLDVLVDEPQDIGSPLLQHVPESAPHVPQSARLAPAHSFTSQQLHGNSSERNSTATRTSRSRQTSERSVKKRPRTSISDEISILVLRAAPIVCLIGAVVRFDVCASFLIIAFLVLQSASTWRHMGHRWFRLPSTKRLVVALVAAALSSVVPFLWSLARAFLSSSDIAPYRSLAVFFGAVPYDGSTSRAVATSRGVPEACVFVYLAATLAWTVSYRTAVGSANPATEGIEQTQEDVEDSVRTAYEYIHRLTFVVGVTSGFSAALRPCVLSVLPFAAFIAYILCWARRLPRAIVLFAHVIVVLRIPVGMLILLEHISSAVYFRELAFTYSPLLFVFFGNGESRDTWSIVLGIFMIGFSYVAICRLRFFLHDAHTEEWLAASALSQYLRHEKVELAESPHHIHYEDSRLSALRQQWLTQAGRRAGSIEMQDMVSPSSYHSPTPMASHRHTQRRGSHVSSTTGHPHTPGVRDLSTSVYVTLLGDSTDIRGDSPDPEETPAPPASFSKTLLTRLWGYLVDKAYHAAVWLYQKAEALLFTFLIAVVCACFSVICVPYIIVVLLYTSPFPTLVSLASEISTSFSMLVYCGLHVSAMFSVNAYHQYVAVKTGMDPSLTFSFANVTAESEPDATLVGFFPATSAEQWIQLVITGSYISDFVDVLRAVLVAILYIVVSFVVRLRGVKGSTAASSESRDTSPANFVSQTVVDGLIAPTAVQVKDSKRESVFSRYKNVFTHCISYNSVNILFLLLLIIATSSVTIFNVVVLALLLFIAVFPGSLSFLWNPVSIFLQVMCFLYFCFNVYYMHAVMSSEVMPAILYSGPPVFFTIAHRWWLLIYVICLMLLRLCSFPVRHTDLDDSSNYRLFDNDILSFFFLVTLRRLFIGSTFVIVTAVLILQSACVSGLALLSMLCFLAITHAFSRSHIRVSSVLLLWGWSLLTLSIILNLAFRVLFSSPLLRETVDNSIIFDMSIARFGIGSFISTEIADPTITLLLIAAILSHFSRQLVRLHSDLCVELIGTPNEPLIAAGLLEWVRSKDQSPVLGVVYRIIRICHRSLIVHSKKVAAVVLFVASLSGSVVSGSQLSILHFLYLIQMMVLLIFSDSRHQKLLAVAGVAYASALAFLLYLYAMLDPFAKAVDRGLGGWEIARYNISATPSETLTWIGPLEWLSYIGISNRHNVFDCMWLWTHMAALLGLLLTLRCSVWAARLSDANMDALSVVPEWSQYHFTTAKCNPDVVPFGGDFPPHHHGTEITFPFSGRQATDSFQAINAHLPVPHKAKKKKSSSAMFWRWRFKALASYLFDSFYSRNADLITSLLILVAITLSKNTIWTLEYLLILAVQVATHSSIENNSVKRMVLWTIILTLLAIEMLVFCFLVAQTGAPESIRLSSLPSLILESPNVEYTMTHIFLMVYATFLRLRVMLNSRSSYHAMTNDDGFSQYYSGFLSYMWAHRRQIATARLNDPTGNILASILPAITRNSKDYTGVRLYPKPIRISTQWLRSALQFIRFMWAPYFVVVLLIASCIYLLSLPYIVYNMYAQPEVTPLPGSDIWLLSQFPAIRLVVLVLAAWVLIDFPNFVFRSYRWLGLLAVYWALFFIDSIFRLRTLYESIESIKFVNALIVSGGANEFRAVIILDCIVFLAIVYVKDILDDPALGYLLVYLQQQCEEREWRQKVVVLSIETRFRHNAAVVEAANRQRRLDLQKVRNATLNPATNEDDDNDAFQIFLSSMSSASRRGAASNTSSASGSSRRTKRPDIKDELAKAQSQSPPVAVMLRAKADSIRSWYRGTVLPLLRPIGRNALLFANRYSLPGGEFVGSKLITTSVRLSMAALFFTYSQWAPFAALILSFTLYPCLLSAVPLITIWYYGIVINPSPHTVYWMALIFWHIAGMLILFFVAAFVPLGTINYFEVRSWLLCRVEQTSGFAAAMFFVVLCVMYHRACRERWGLWNDWDNPYVSVRDDEQSDDASEVPLPDLAQVLAEAPVRQADPDGEFDFVEDPQKNSKNVQFDVDDNNPPGNPSEELLSVNDDDAEQNQQDGSFAFRDGLDVGLPLTMQRPAYELPFGLPNTIEEDDTPWRELPPDDERPRSPLPPDAQYPSTTFEVPDHISEHSSATSHDSAEVNRATVRKLVISFVTFYKNNIIRTERKTGIDLFGAIFALDIVFFIVFFFSYYKIVGNDQNLFHSIQNNVFPGPLVVFQLFLFVLLLLERVIYIFQSLPAKLVLLFSQALFVLPIYIYFINISPSQIMQFLFLLKAFSLCVSSIQIKVGFAPTVISTFTKKKPWWMIQNASYKVYRVIPFAFEMQNILDWTFTKTTLKLKYWLQLEDIRHELIVCHFDKVDSMHDGRDAKAAYPTGTKARTGGILIPAIMFLLFFPLYYYSSFSPGLVYNSVDKMVVTVTLAGSDTSIPLYSGQFFGSSSNSFEADAFVAYRIGATHPSLPASLFESSELSMKPQIVRMLSASVSTFDVPPSILQQIVTALPASSYVLETTIQVHRSLEITTKHYQTISRQYQLSQEERLNLASILNSTVPGNTYSSVMNFTVKNFITPYYKNAPKTVAPVLPDPECSEQTRTAIAGDHTCPGYLDCFFELVPSNPVPYWTLQCSGILDTGTKLCCEVPSSEVDSLGNPCVVHCNERESRCFSKGLECPNYDTAARSYGHMLTGPEYVFFNEKVPTGDGVGAFLQSLGIVTLYTTFVLAVGRILRGGFTGGAGTIFLSHMHVRGVAVLDDHLSFWVHPVLISFRTIRIVELFKMFSANIVCSTLQNPDPVLSLVSFIYLARLEGDLELEERLFNELLQLYRSPKKMLVWTGAPAVGSKYY